MLTARRPAAEVAETKAPSFVPAVVDTAPSVVRRKRERTRRAEQTSGIIEVEIESVTVRVGRGAEAKTVAAVLRFAGRRMIGPTGAVRVMVATRPVDFRKGAKGLAALVREEMHADPF